MMWAAILVAGLIGHWANPQGVDPHMVWIVLMAAAVWCCETKY